MIGPRRTRQNGDSNAEFRDLRSCSTRSNSVVAVADGPLSASLLEGDRMMSVQRWVPPRGRRRSPSPGDPLLVLIRVPRLPNSERRAGRPRTAPGHGPVGKPAQLRSRIAPIAATLIVCSGLAVVAVLLMIHLPQVLVPTSDPDPPRVTISLDRSDLSDTRK